MKSSDQSFYVREMKDKGHALIDELVALGIERNEVYRKLRKRMGRLPPQFVHFSQMHTPQMLSKAVRHLEEMRNHERKLGDCAKCGVRH